MRIYLTGFMGTGKTSLGKALARHLNIPFLDTDTLVEARAGRTIPDIFRDLGEKSFRELENEALKSASNLSNAVIATGGGIVLDKANRDLMLSTGAVINLWADPDIIYSRISKDAGRPLLSVPNPLQEICRLLKERQPFYEECHFRFNTGSISQADMIAQICSIIPYHQRLPDFADCHHFSNGYFIRVELDLGEKSHPIFIKSNGLDTMGSLVSKHISTGSGVVIISEPIAWTLFGHQVAGSLQTEGIKTGTFLIDGSERSKCLKCAKEAYDYLISFGALKDTVIIALGGGVVGDLAGFVASTYMRGIPFVQASTTLLGQVDAGIGGKCAVNHLQGKNLIGAIYQPKLCLMDPFTLLSLPEVEFRQGLAEVVKYGLLIGEGFLSYLEENADLIREMSIPVLTELVAKCASYKSSLVQIDEEDRNERQFLNLGHTLAHALESMMGYSGIHHGDAVGIGLAWATGLSERVGLAPPGLQQRAINLLKKLDIPFEIPERFKNESTSLIKRMMLDKKNRENKLRLVLLKKPGDPILVEDIPREILQHSLGL